ncbi:MAG: MEDS domain-containing protein [Nitrososphaerales archaeon]
MISKEVSEFLAEFRTRTHAVVFYNSQETKQDVLYNHLKFGARDQGLAYVCSDESPLQIREEMKRFGIDVEGLGMRNRLKIENYDKIYIVDGQVNVQSIMNAFSDLSKKYSTMGLEGMRAGAEMSCFFHEHKVKELIDYENALHRTLSFPAEGICGYNVADLYTSRNLQTIMPIVRAHDPVIFAGPKESLILEPNKVEMKDFAETMNVKLN